MRSHDAHASSPGCCAALLLALRAAAAARRPRSPPSTPTTATATSSCCCSASTPRRAADRARLRSASRRRRPQLYAYDLATRRLLWQRRVAASSAPLLAGDAWWLQSGDRIVGFDLHSGEPRFDDRPRRESLKGADGEGALRAIVIGEGQGTFAKSELRAGQRRLGAWRRAVDRLVGVPAVVGTMVLVPWSNQFLSAIDVPSGNEFARVRVRDGVIAHALRDGGRSTSAASTASRASRRRSARARSRARATSRCPSKSCPAGRCCCADVYTQSGAGAERKRAASHRAGLASDRARPRPRRRCRTTTCTWCSTASCSRSTRATTRCAGSTSTTPTSSARQRRRTASRVADEARPVRVHRRGVGRACCGARAARMPSQRRANAARRQRRRPTAAHRCRKASWPDGCWRRRSTPTRGSCRRVCSRSTRWRSCKRPTPPPT